MTGDEEAGTLVAEAAIFTPIIAFTHVVEVESSLNFLFKWVVPLAVYFLYLLRVFSRRKGRVEKSNSLVPYISALSKIGVIYVLYGLTSDFFTLPTALTVVLIIAVVTLLAIELWIGGFSNFSEFAVNRFEEKADEEDPIPYLENMAYLSQYIDLSQEHNKIRKERYLMAIVTSVTISVIYTLVVLVIYGFLWLLSVDIRFSTILITAFPLLFLKTVVSYLYSGDGYGSVEYSDIMGFQRHGLPSLTLNIYLITFLA